jgi:hypothetical protein
MINLYNPPKPPFAFSLTSIIESSLYVILTWEYQSPVIGLNYIGNKWVHYYYMKE